MLNEFENYLQKYFPRSDFRKNWSLCHNAYIRFELGLGFENGTPERCNQAKERALTLFNELFAGEETLWILIYRYLENEIYESTEGFLEAQFAKETWKTFNTEIVYASTSTIDEDGTEKYDTAEVDIICGKCLKTEMNEENILLGKANFEMGMEPAINDSVYFFAENQSLMFYMYDDRGCLIFADEPDKIRNIYERYNSWIVDYWRKDIDEIFENNPV